MNKTRGSIINLLILIVVICTTLIPATANEPEKLKIGWDEYIKTGNTLNALEKFSEAYNISPGKMKVAASYSQLLIQIGHYREAAKVLTNSFKICKWNEWCEPALADLESIISYLEDTNELRMVLKIRLANPEISWIEKSLISDLLAKLLIINENIDEAEAIYDSAGFVKNWYILGPFSNRNQQEFLVSNKFEDEIAIVDLQKKWQGRGREIAWEELKAPADGVVNLGMAMYPSEESMGYMLCFVQSNTKGEAVIALEESGASALWCNGELKYVDTTYTQNNSALQRLIRVTLEKGINQIVLKIAGGRDILPKARLRVVAGNVESLNEAGSARFVANNKYNTYASEKYAKEYAVSENVIKGAGRMPVIEQGDSWGAAGALWGALAKFEEMSSSDELKPFYEHALSLMNMGYLVSHYGFDSSDSSRERVYDMLLITEYPNCPLFLNSAAYVQLGDNSKRALLLRAVNVSPMEIAAREGLMHLQVKGGFYSKAWESAERIAKESGWSFSTYNTIAGIAERNNWQPEASLYYRKALEYSNGSGWVYARAAGSSGSIVEAISILKNARQRVFDESLAEALAGWLYKDSKYTESRDVYSQLLRIQKYVEEYWDASAACSVALGDYNSAIDSLKEGLVWMPQSPILREKIGRLYVRIGDKKLGLEYLEDALEFQKNNPDLIAYIKELSSNSNEFYASEDIDYDSLTGRDAVAKDYPQYDRVCLLDQNYVAVSENGTTKRMVRTVIKVLRNSAINEVSSTGVYYDSSRQKVELKHARVVQPTGEINENPVVQDGNYNTGFDAGGIYGSAQVRSIQLPNVKEGSIVDIMYTIEDMGANVYHDEFSDIIYMGGVEPTLKFIYTAVIPSDMDVRSEVYGSDKLATVVDQGDGMTRVRLEVDNVAGIEVEPMMPPLQEVKPSLVVSTFKSWEDLAKWANGLFAPAIILPDDIKEFVHSLVENAKTRDEKIAAIYEYVTKNIRYVSISYGRFGYAPHKAERTFRSGYGDCKDTAALLAAMLQEVGVEAYPTLTRTSDLGPLLETLPSPELFNHSIAYVPAQDDPIQDHYWLDGTTDYFSLGMIPAMDRGTKSLIINPTGGLEKIDKMEPEQDAQVSRIYMTVNKDGSGIINGRESYIGRAAMGMKRTFEKPEAFFSMLRGFFNKRYAGVNINNLDYSKGDEESGSWFEYSITSPKVAVSDGNELKLLPWVLPIDLSGIAVLKDREYDLVLRSPKIFEIVSDIKVTDDLKIIELENVDEEIDSVSYKRNTEKIEGGIRVTTRIVLKENRIPRANYSEFREFINTITAKSREWLFLVK